MGNWYKYSEALCWLKDNFPLSRFPKMTQEEIKHYEIIEEMLKQKITELSEDDDRPLGGFHDW